jgi:amino acid transporter
LWNGGIGKPVLRIRPASQFIEFVYYNYVFTIFRSSKLFSGPDCHKHSLQTKPGNAHKPERSIFMETLKWWQWVLIVWAIIIVCIISFINIFRHWRDKRGK